MIVVTIYNNFLAYLKNKLGSSLIFATAINRLIIEFLFEVTITDSLFNFNQLSIRFTRTEFTMLCPLTHQDLYFSKEFRDFVFIVIFSWNMIQTFMI